MNIIQYLTVGIHTCFRIKKPPQKKSPLSAQSASNFQSKTQLPTSKNPKNQNFFISFHISIYKFFAYKKPAFFNQMRMFALIMGARFFNCPKNESRFTNHKPLRGTTNEPFNQSQTLTWPVIMRNRTTIKPPIPTPSGFRNFAFYTLHFDFSSLAPLHLSRILYKSTLFMQNKPNLLNSQMNVTSLITVDYGNIANWTLGENKPNSKPIKPNTNPIPERPEWTQLLL